MKRARARFDLFPLVIHVNYLVNLASSDAGTREKSIAAFRGELERARAIGAEYLVVHPGSYRGQSLEQGIAAFALGLAAAVKGIAAGGVTILLENTVGCGSQIGCRFEELRAIRELAGKLIRAPVGYCLDTCHLFSAGFDIASEAGLRETVRQADRILGIDNVKVIHANDSKKLLGSHLDRHQHIGAGHIGRDGFRRILAHPKLRSKPFILETPVEQEGDDQRNIDTLKSLCRKSLTTTT